MSVSVSIDDSNSGGVLLYYDPLLLEDPSADGVRTDVYIVLTTGHSKIVAPENSYRLFAFENLSQINFNGMLDTSQVGNMDSMFYSCSVTSLDLFGFKTANVYNMMEMFAGCRNLTTLTLPDDFGAACSEMNDMFVNCSALVTLDLSKMNTESSDVLSYMFQGCTSLQNLTLPQSFGSNAYIMQAMFKDCTALTELNLSNMDIRNLTNSLDGDGLQSMFSGCTGLQTIYVDPELWVVQDGVLGTDMFKDCTSLVGGSGTVYSADYVDSSYARIDGGVEAPGYLTAAQGEPNGG